MTAVSPAHDSRFVLHRATTADHDFGHDVRIGLTAPRKWLPPRWFYDDLGSSLFDAICFLPEYYVLRAESEILTSFRDEIVRSFGPHIRLVELGSGAARKTRILLDALTERQPNLEYVPVDIDAAMLERTGRDLLNEYASLRVTAVAANFSDGGQAILPVLNKRDRLRTIVLFLGSTIGNFEPDAATAMLRDLRSALNSGDALFLGADLKKDRTILDPAYDDPLGVTAAFNRNILGRINRELGGRFDFNAFRHRAFYDEARGRVEMHLVSTCAHRVRIDALDLEIAFEESESIHTESSYKHDATTLAALAAASGFTVKKTWTDSRGWFADVLMIAG